MSWQNVAGYHGKLPGGEGELNSWKIHRFLQAQKGSLQALPALPPAGCPHTCGSHSQTWEIRVPILTLLFTLKLVYFLDLFPYL